MIEAAYEALDRNDLEGAAALVAGTAPDTLSGEDPDSIAVAINRDPQEAADLLHRLAEDESPGRIFWKAFRLWFNADWRPIRPDRLLPLFRVLGSNSLGLHVARLVWNGYDASQGLAETLSWLRPSAAWGALPSIDVAGKFFPERLDDLKFAPVAAHLILWRPDLTEEFPDAVPDAHVLESLRLRKPDVPLDGVTPDLLFRFVNAWWREEPERAREALIRLEKAKDDCWEMMLVGMPGLPEFAPALVDHALDRMEDLDGQWIYGCGLLPRLGEEHWGRLLPTLNSGSAAVLLEETLAAYDPPANRVEELRKIVASQDREEREQVAAGIQLLERTVERDGNVRGALWLIGGVPARKPTRPEIFRVLQVLARLTDERLAVLEPYLRMFLDSRIDSFVEPQLRGACFDVCRRAAGPATAPPSLRTLPS